jgi:hypothetical protein
MPPALRAELPFIRRHALRDAGDVRNKPAAHHPGVVGAILALLQRTFGGLFALCPSGL